MRGMWGEHICRSPIPLSGKTDVLAAFKVKDGSIVVYKKGQAERENDNETRRLIKSFQAGPDQSIESAARLQV